jgi:uncharacterized protein
MRVAAFITGIVLLAVSCKNSDPAYTQRIMQIRANKTYEFLDKKTTPLTASKLAAFKGLPYYEPDKTFLVHATFTRKEQPQIFGMPHTLDLTFNYSEAGTLAFKLDGKNLQLTAFLREGMKGDTVSLFIPFTDLTNETETYGGGRYLDVKAVLNQPVIDLDFNLAYNPYCAYNKEFSCPIPPKQNHLPVAIRAGEKYQHE